MNEFEFDCPKLSYDLSTITESRNLGVDAWFRVDHATHEKNNEVHLSTMQTSDKDDNVSNENLIKQKAVRRESLRNYNDCEPTDEIEITSTIRCESTDICVSKVATNALPTAAIPDENTNMNFSNIDYASMVNKTSSTSGTVSAPIKKKSVAMMSSKTSTSTARKSTTFTKVVAVIARSNADESQALSKKAKLGSNVVNSNGTISVPSRYLQQSTTTTTVRSKSTRITTTSASSSSSSSSTVSSSTVSSGEEGGRRGVGAAGLHAAQAQ